MAPPLLRDGACSYRELSGHRIHFEETLGLAMASDQGY